MLRNQFIKNKSFISLLDKKPKIKRDIFLLDVAKQLFLQDEPIYICLISKYKKKNNKMLFWPKKALMRINNTFTGSLVLTKELHEDTFPFLIVRKGKFLPISLDNLNTSLIELASNNFTAKTTELCTLNQSLYLNSPLSNPLYNLIIIFKLKYGQLCTT